MRHLRIKLVGHLNIARPAWPIQRHSGLYYDSQLDAIPDIHYEHEPIVQVEIDKRTWDAMFDLYEAHLKGFANPTVQDAWEQYLIASKLCGLEGFGGDKQI